MNCSKLLSSFKLSALVAVLAMSVTACMKPSARGEDPNNQFSEKQATFSNDEVKGDAVVSKNLEGFSIPTEKLFNFKTCVKDKRTEQPIKGHKFSITGAPGEVVVGNDGRSDEAGCVTWSEKLDYNGVGDAKFLPIKRMIVASGMHTGARELKLCINPWDTGAAAVRDCGKNAVPEEQLAKIEEIPALLRGETKTGQKSQPHLWIDDMRINAAHDPGGSDGAMVDLSVSMGPKILTKNIRGESVPTALTDGDFDTQFWVIAKTGDRGVGKCLVIAKTGSEKAFSMLGGRLRSERKIRVRYMISYGQLELVGIVTPKTKNFEIASYNGLWMLGDHTALLGMKFAFERKEAYTGGPGTFDAKKYAENCTDVSGSFNLEKALTSATAEPAIAVASRAERAAGQKVLAKYKNGSEGAMAIPTFLKDRAALKASIPEDLINSECVQPEDIPRLFPLDEAAQNFKPGADVITCDNQYLPGAVYKVEQFEFENVQVRAEPIADPINGETTTERTVKYVVTTTVRNPMSPSSPVRDILFKVKTASGKIENIRTNPQGQLIFNDEIKHKYFHPERYMLKIVEISNTSGFNRRLPIVLNPWDNNGWTFGRDIRILRPFSIAQVNLIPRPISELLLTQFQWGTQGFNYKVDSALNLIQLKDFNITLSPRVLRYSSLTEGRMKNEALRDGIYIMKVAIQKDYKPLNDGPQEYITAIKKLVRVANGMINTPVTMEFRDFRVLKIRSNILIEIQTIDESKLSQKQRKELQYDGPIDSLIVQNSGLEPRTFVGPVVAYSNGFSASMRPTDDLSEAICGTIDCDEVKRDEARHAAMVMCAHAQANDDVCKTHNFNEKETAQLSVLRCSFEGDSSAACKSLRLSDASNENAERHVKEIEIQRKSAQLFDSYAGYPEVWRQQSAILAKSTQKMTTANAKVKAELAQQEKKFRGSIDHLLNKTVGDMLDRQAVLKAQNEQKNRESANFARVLAIGNFEYGALANEKVIVAQNAGVKNNNQVLSKEGTALVDLIGRLSTNDPHNRFIDSGMERVYRQLAPKQIVDMNEFRNTMFEGGQLSTDLAARFCIFFVEDMVLRRNEKSEASLGFSDQKRAAYTRKKLNESCLKEVLATSGKNPSSSMSKLFNVEHMLRVFRIDDSKGTGGNLLSFSRGAGQSVGQSRSESFAYSWTPLGIFKVIPGVKDLFDALGWSASSSWSDSTSLGDGTSAGENTSLAVELTGTSLTIAEHERCTAIRLNTPALEKMHADLQLGFDRSLSELERSNRVSRGILLCEGILRRKPTQISERFYMFSQGIGEEVANDPVAIENHPYLKSIRGRTNYVEFVTALTNQPAKIDRAPLQITLGEFSQEKMTTVFNSPSPTLPGILRLDPFTIRQMQSQ